MKRLLAPLFLCGLLALATGPAVAGLRDGLLAYYPFEGDLTDASDNGHDAQPSGGDPVFVIGLLGQGLDTRAASADCGTWDPSDNPDEAFSASCWIYWLGLEGAAAPWQGIMAKRADWSAGQNRWQLEIGDNQTTAYFTNQPNGGAASVPIIQEEWQHIVLTFDGTTGTAYSNGTPVGSGPWGLDTNRDAPLNIGQSQPVHGNAFNGTIDEVGFWGRALSAEEVGLLFHDGQGLSPLGAPTKAREPRPEDDATDVYRDTDLSWTASAFAATHDVYLGTNWDDVNAATLDSPRGVLLRAGQTEANVDPGRLGLGQTYYWRVDEVNAAPDQARFSGKVWSFTVEPLAYPVAATEVSATASSAAAPQVADHAADGSGLAANGTHSAALETMWVSSPADPDPWIRFALAEARKLTHLHIWNHNSQSEGVLGFGIKDAVIETSLDGVTWSQAAAQQIPQAPGNATYAGTDVDLGNVYAAFVRIRALSNWSALGLAQRGLSEVRFYALPLQARKPRPADGELTADLDLTLGWHPGRLAGTHDVRRSTDNAAVDNDTAPVSTVTENHLDLDDLHFGDTVFWRVDEVNDTETPPVVRGPRWQFSVPRYAVVDNFETYKAEDGLYIWEHWADGFEDPANGSVVGNGDDPEQQVVYEGRQALPLHYDNRDVATSEATRRFDPALDWTHGAPSSLSLQIRGGAPDFLQRPDGSLVVGAAGKDIWDAADEFRFVYRHLHGDGSITARVQSLDAVHPWSKAGVMIRADLAPNAVFMDLVATGTNGVGFQGRLAPFGGATADNTVRDAAQAAQEEPVWLRLERRGDEFTAFWSADGVQWNAAAWNPQTASMPQDVYIGLCVTSHQVGIATQAVFTDVASTGQVTGDWTAAAIGGEHPSNDPDGLYLVLADAAGHSQRIPHPDPAATLRTPWETWLIPLADLGSLDLGRITALTLGVGQPGGSPTGAQGTVYLDLVRVGTPEP